MMAECIIDATVVQQTECLRKKETLIYTEIFCALLEILKGRKG